MVRNKHCLDTSHRDLSTELFWQRVPAWKDVDEATFLDWKWQAQNTVTKPQQVLDLLKDIVSPAFLEDVREGFKGASMSVRVSPYIFGLIDWDQPYTDPQRIQFVPLKSRFRKDHPLLTFDSLGEQKDSAVPGLTHRYSDKALFLAMDTCTVYCRYCTRSYAVGSNTQDYEKIQLRVNRMRWQRAYDYIRSTPHLEDIVISGGDTYQLKADQVAEIGEALLSIPHVRRLRWATKGPAIMPMKLLTDHDWVDALTGVVEQGRKQNVEVCVHTHFNHPKEITDITQRSLSVLFQRGITVRNQSVLIRGVNDDPEIMKMLVKRLAYVNIHPYYVYVHDLVSGAEDLRTTVGSAVAIEKQVRGSTAGFKTPTFVVDAPGGGGKRDAHSYEHYNRETGVSVYRSPAVNPDKLYFYCDPIDLLPESGQARWADPSEHDRIIAEATEAALANRHQEAHERKSLLHLPMTSANDVEDVEMSGAIEVLG
ncbi:MAG: KamA family radical SAM protein [Myxococcota bacterium]|nr:KamA family radical SAM protein [Myxococcota bacterium]